jgi:hypothetical protein
MAVPGSLMAMSVTLAACSGGSSPPSASSNAGTPDPNAVLRFGVDLNNGFSKDFDPGSNECSFQELSQSYSSITYEPPGTQGNEEILPGIAQTSRSPLSSSPRSWRTTRTALAAPSCPIGYWKPNLAGIYIKR